MNWKLYDSLSQFSPEHLHAVLQLRQNVFIIEQDCIYPDIDELDSISEHLLLFIESKLAGYLRVVPAGEKFKEISLGRIVIDENFRGKGLGKKLVQKGISILEQKGVDKIRIEAQLYLEVFYTDLGFVTKSSPYDVDGIPHIEMLYKSSISR